jgi:glycine cleavage system transcriptional repressor
MGYTYMEKRYVLTAFGEDRPGVVADVTGLIYEIGGNLEDSTMTRLADEFTIILLFSSGTDIEDELGKACRRLEKERGVSAFFRRAAPFGGKKESHALHRVHAEGIDHTGIVYRISYYLASMKVNIANLSSRRTTSPESGTARYILEIEIEVPANVSIDRLRKDLVHLGEEITVDISV